MVQLCRDASPYAFGSGVLFNLLNLALVGFSCSTSPCAGASSAKRLPPKYEARSLDRKTIPTMNCDASALLVVDFQSRLMLAILDGAAATTNAQSLKRSSFWRAFNERRSPGRSQPWAAAAVLPVLHRKMPPEGLAGALHRDAVRRSDGAASSVSVHGLQSHRTGRLLAIAMPIDTRAGPTAGSPIRPEDLSGRR